MSIPASTRIRVPEIPTASGKLSPRTETRVRDLSLLSKNLKQIATELDAGASEVQRASAALSTKIAHRAVGSSLEAARASPGSTPELVNALARAHESIGGILEALPGAPDSPLATQFRVASGHVQDAEDAARSAFPDSRFALDMLEAPTAALPAHQLDQAMQNPQLRRALDFDATRVQRFLRRLSPWLVKAFTHGEGVRMIGTEHLPTGPYILAATHANFVTDGPVYLSYFTRQAPGAFRTMMAAGQGRKGKVSDRILTHLGVFTVRRGPSADDSLALGKELLRRGQNVVIMPEGFLNGTDTVSLANNGIAQLSLDTGIPIVPLAIYGDKAISAKTPGAGVVMSIGKPLEPGGAPAGPNNVGVQRDRLQLALDAEYARAREVREEAAPAPSVNTLRAADPGAARSPWDPYFELPFHARSGEDLLPSVSGRGGSEVPYDALNFGQQKLLTQTTPGHHIAEVMGVEAAQDPTRIVLNDDLATRPYAQAKRALKMLEAHDAYNGDKFDFLNIATPVAKGIGPPAALAALEYLTYGRTASVTMPYGDTASLPGGISRRLVARLAQRALLRGINRALQSRIAQGLPVPQSVQTAESMGAWFSQEALGRLAPEDVLAPGDRHLDYGVWAGTPYWSRWARAQLGDGNVSRDGQLREFPSSTELLERGAGGAAFVLLSNPNDPVSQLGPKLLYKPPYDWPGSFKRLQSFLLTAKALPEAARPDAGVFVEDLHEYRPIWAPVFNEVLQLGHSPATIERVQERLHAYEVSRTAQGVAAKAEFKKANEKT